MTRIAHALALTVLAFVLTACGGGAVEVETPDGNSYPSKLVGKVEVDGDADPEIRQFTFTDLDGVEQKCFLYGRIHGSMTCQPLASNPTPAR